MHAASKIRALMAEQRSTYTQIQELTSLQFRASRRIHKGLRAGTVTILVARSELHVRRNGSTLMTRPTSDATNFVGSISPRYNGKLHSL